MRSLRYYHRSFAAAIVAMAVYGYKIRAHVTKTGHVDLMHHAELVRIEERTERGGRGVAACFISARPIITEASIPVT